MKREFLNHYKNDLKLTDMREYNLQ